MSKETMFPKFGDLPKELRLQVYENAFPRRVLRFCERLLPGHMGLTGAYKLEPRRFNSTSLYIAHHAND